MDMPADFILKATLPPSSGKGAVVLSSVMPGYHSGQRLASLKSAMVSCGEALIWAFRCTIAIVGLLPRLCRHASVTRLGQSAAAGPDRTIVEMVTYGLNEPLREQSISAQRECRAAHDRPRDTSYLPIARISRSGRQRSSPQAQAIVGDTSYSGTIVATVSSPMR